MLFNECDSLWPSKVSDIFNTTRCNDTRSFITLKFLLIYVSIKTKTKISKVPYLCNAIRIEWLDLTCHYMLILKHNIIILAAQTKLNWSTLLPIYTIITSPRNPQIPKNLYIYHESVVIVTTANCWFRHSCLVLSRNFLGNCFSMMMYKLLNKIHHLF